MRDKVPTLNEHEYKTLRYILRLERLFQAVKDGKSSAQIAPDVLRYFTQGGWIPVISSANEGGRSRSTYFRLRSRGVIQLKEGRRGLLVRLHHEYNFMRRHIKRRAIPKTKGYIPF